MEGGTRDAWLGIAIALACFGMGLRHVERPAQKPFLPALAAAEPGALEPLPDRWVASRARNVILISIDTLRADHLSAYGYPRNTSPAVDALARESVLFESAFSQSPKTAESHMTLLTGLYPSAHGVRNLRASNARLSDDIPTLATLLSRAGYRTVGFHGAGNVDAELGFDQGFDTYVAPGAVDAVFGSGAEWLETHLSSPDREQPFFLFLHTKVLHDPYRPAPRYAALFTDPDYAGEVGTDAGLHAAQKSGGYWRMHALYWDRVDPKTPADVQQLRDLYDALIRNMVDELAQVLARARGIGALRNTLLVFLSPQVDIPIQFFSHPL